MTTRKWNPYTKDDGIVTVRIDLMNLGKKAKIDYLKTIIKLIRDMR